MRAYIIIAAAALAACATPPETAEAPAISPAVYAVACQHGVPTHLFARVFAPGVFVIDLRDVSVEDCDHPAPKDPTRGML